MIHLKGFGMFPKKVQLTNPNVNSEKYLERSFCLNYVLESFTKNPALKFATRKPSMKVSSKMTY